jgi:gliding motility-associated lipoprotein GldH
MKLKINVILYLFCLISISCDKKRVFDEYASVGNSWHKDSIVRFDLPELEKNKNFDLFVTIRNNNNYPFNNLFLIVALEQPNKKVKVDTLEYMMANPDGSLLGEGFSDIKENKLFYKSNQKFDLKGKYAIFIKHAVRQNGKVKGVQKLDGITDVGFRIESKD